MSNELVVKNEMSFESSMLSFDNMQAMCKKLMQSKHYSKMGEEGVFAIIQKAKSLGMDPIDALGGSLFYVNGKTGMSTEAMNAIIRRAGHSITKDDKSNSSICILHGKRADNGDTWTVSFSIDDAKRAGLMKNMYEKFPGIMIFNRALSMLARQLFPDVIKGAGYTLDELKEIEKSDYSFSNPKQEPKLMIEEKPIETITQEQAANLANTMADCEIKYIEDVWTTLKKLGITDIEKIPVNLFDRLMVACEKNRMTYQESLRTLGDTLKDQEVEAEQ